MLSSFGRRRFLRYSTAGLGASLLLNACTDGPPESGAAPTANGESTGEQASGDVIKVGLLHSLTGTMAISEAAIVDAEELAIEEINRAGGVLGKSIEIIKEDGASQWPTFAEKAAKLIDEDGVATVFGCWTSASRKAVLPVFEEKNHLLWYPVRYEGQECSKNVFYTGALPNQQIEPAVTWLLENEGNRFFLVGSDQAFSQTTSAIIKQQLSAVGGEVVGEAYLPFGGTDVVPVFDEIRSALPEGGIIFNSLSGDSNIAFFRELGENLGGPDRYPVMSVSVTEEVVQRIGPEFLGGHYASWNYFQTIDTAENEAWVSDVKAEYGQKRVTSDPMEAAYITVHLWKMAVEKAGTADDLEAIRAAAYGLEFDAPEGPVRMNVNHHLSKTVRIGRVRDDGLFEIVFTSAGPIAPRPWNQYLPETEGFACDWSDREKGGKYRLED